VSDYLLRLFIALGDRIDRADHGQTTAEYALVMLAADAISGFVLA